MADILTVTSLNLYVKSLLENDSNLIGIAVEGELSNFKKYPSGHCYFTLKDEKSTIKCVMFQSYVRGINFVPDNGMKVIVRGKVSLYERDGAYQLYVTNMFLSGTGSYQIAFEKLKEKLGKEGLFNLETKKTLPQFPFKIGVATSPKGAALHDIISTAQRRFPCAEIILAPCMVQGAEAEPTIINAIKQLDEMNDIDLIIIARGGGSKEDLWVFNSEAIARTAFACRKPTISAIGHEIDFSILDFVCDVRAATPTQAAEIALPDINSLKMQISSLERNILNTINSNFRNYKNNLTIIEKSDGFLNVINRTNREKDRLLSIQKQLKINIERKIELLANNVYTKTEILQQQSPLNNLKRGYALIYKENSVVKNYSFTPGESAKMITDCQEIDFTVTKTKNRKA